MGSGQWRRTQAGIIEAPGVIELAKFMGEVYCTMGDKNIFPDTGHLKTT